MTAVLLGGGGTGGHVTPALATAEALHGLRPGIDVGFVGTARGVEAELVPQAGWRLHTVDALPLRRRISPDLLKVPFVVARAAGEVRRLIAAYDVAAACVFGGYVSGPLALAARRARIPLVLHEQNAVPGLANRIAARWAVGIAVSVPQAGGAFRRRAPVVFTGNPVRPELARLDRAAGRDDALQAFGLEPGRRTLLVFGGSLGARRLNEAVLDAALRWSRPASLQVLHAAGTRDHERVIDAWAERCPQGTARDDGYAGETAQGLVVRCVPFIERMDLAYAAADVALCRAGASTIAELAVVGLPAVLVPYPHAAADEQTANAAALADADAAVLVADGDLDGAALVAAAEPLLADAGRLAAMAAAARRLGRPDAAERLARLVIAAAEGRLTALLDEMGEDGARP